MAFTRSFLNLTNLPDGTVLATGGGTDKSAQIDANGVLVPESWDPADRKLDHARARWRRRASTTPSRSCCRTGASTSPAAAATTACTDQTSAQIFSPPYLFKGARPTISSAPATVHVRRTAFVGTPDAASIRRVSLIRTGSVTHAFDQNARAMSLAVHADRRRPRREDAGERQLRPARLLHALPRQRQGRAVGRLVRPLPAPYEDERGAHRADEPDAATGAARRRVADVDRRQRRRRRHQLQRPPLDDPRLHAVRREQGRPERRHAFSDTGWRPGPTTTG